MKSNTSWNHCKKILCIRLDNMGDVLMTSPALRALKETFDANLTLLTSRAGSEIAKYLPEIDDTIIFDVPWVKSDDISSSSALTTVIEKIKKQNFDASIIFTNFSQNPLPSVMIAYLAQIPLRLAYCRENPYRLLTHWVPDPEPFETIRHGVTRSLELVKTIGASTEKTRLSLHISDEAVKRMRSKLQKKGIKLTHPIIVIHPGVSETKRQYPPMLFAKAAHELIRLFDCQIVITGTAAEKKLAKEIAEHVQTQVFNLTGQMSLNELIALISESDILISNNTGPVHIASAVNTPVIVMYARTNPEHIPWHVPHKTLYFDVPKDLRSKNKILEYLTPEEGKQLPAPSDIVDAARKLLHKYIDDRYIVTSYNPEVGLWE